MKAKKLLKKTSEEVTEWRDKFFRVSLILVKCDEQNEALQKELIEVKTENILLKSQNADLAKQLR